MKLKAIRDKGCPKLVAVVPCWEIVILLLFARDRVGRAAIFAVFKSALGGV